MKKIKPIQNLIDNAGVKKIKILHTIMRTTHMYEVLSGFVVYFVITALLIWLVDPNITKFSDSLWYCFAVCTTIGFGDVVATSVLGRLLSVVLSIYGILIVAYIPGVIVNYFMEFNKAKQNKSIVQFFDKLENLDELSKEELKELSELIKKKRYKL